MKLTKNQLRQIIKEEKSKILKEMAQGPADGYGGFEYREDKSQFNDAHSELKTPLGHASNMSDVSLDLFDTLMAIFQEAEAKGMTKESILAVAKDAARDYDV